MCRLPVEPAGTGSHRAAGGRLHILAAGGSTVVGGILLQPLEGVVGQALVGSREDIELHQGELDYIVELLGLPENKKVEVAVLLLPMKGFQTPMKALDQGVGVEGILQVKVHSYLAALHNQLLHKLAVVVVQADKGLIEEAHVDDAGFVWADCVDFEVVEAKHCIWLSSRSAVHRCLEKETNEFWLFYLAFEELPLSCHMKHQMVDLGDLAFQQCIHHKQNVCKRPS